MAMLRDRVAMRSWVSVRLLVSSRSWDDVIYRSELVEIDRDEMGVEVIDALTRSEPPDWMGYDRRVDREMLTDVAWPAADRPFATCAACGSRFGEQAIAANERRGNFGAFRGSFVEPAPRSSRTKPPDAVGEVRWTAIRGGTGWRGRIRTFDLLIQRTPDVSPDGRCDSSVARTRIRSIRRAIRLNIPDRVR
jgi:hypothetical protein